MAVAGSLVIKLIDEFQGRLGRRWARIRILRQQDVNESLEVIMCTRQRRYRSAYVLLQYFVRRIPLERRLLRQHLIKHDPGTVQVGTCIRNASQDSFRAHVGGGPEQRTLLSHPWFVKNFGDPEVDQRNTAILAKHNIVRLQITMHDPGRMDVAQRQENLPENRHDTSLVDLS